MAAEFRLIAWNARKLRYDAVVVALLAAWMVGWVLVAGGREVPREPANVWMAAFGTAAIVALHAILAIGPLARLDRRFLPLLYNRRHLGVIFFLVAATHAGFGVGEILGPDSDTPLARLLSGTGAEAGAESGESPGFPFELLGIAALLVFAAMAFTSHDRWLAKLSPRLWKVLHMLVYGAYALVVVHVALGELSSESGVDDHLFAGLLIAGAALVAGLHMVAGRRERRRDTGGAAPAVVDVDGRRWIDAGPAEAIPEGRATVVSPPGGERIAVFRHRGAVCALANVCSHQNGPLGEGEIVDGLVTCPWHGYQFRPEDGCAPPPYTDRVPTYRVRLAGGRVLVDPEPLALGTASPPVQIGG